MLAKERQDYILDILDHRGVVYLKEVSMDLHVSMCTIRRDFEKLESESKCKRVHGGAVKVIYNHPLQEETDLHMSKRERMNIEDKKALCKKCAELVEDGDCIFIDGGTTFMYMMDYLRERRISIVSHSDFIRHRDNALCSVFILGGENSAKYKMNLGPMVNKYLKNFHFDKAFISCAGFTVDDLKAYTAEIATAQVKQTAIKNAKLSYLVMDSSKIGMDGFYNFMNLDSMQGFITTKQDLDLKTKAQVLVVE